MWIVRLWLYFHEWTYDNSVQRILAIPMVGDISHPTSVQTNYQSTVGLVERVAGFSPRSATVVAVLRWFLLDLIGLFIQKQCDPHQ
jgi:hypothetical protein